MSKVKIERKIEFDLIENVTNRVALKRNKLDIFIDQIEIKEDGDTE